MFLQSLYSLVVVLAQICLQKTVQTQPDFLNETNRREWTSLEHIKRVETVNWDALDYTVFCKFQSYTFKCGNKPPENSYYYDIKLQDCVSTMYGHCKHGYNNFKTRKECKETCRDKGLDVITSNLTDEVNCYFQPDLGDCFQYLQMFYFDIDEHKCRGFGYSGCGGNPNRFSNVKECQATCDDLVTQEEQ